MKSRLLMFILLITLCFSQSLRGTKNLIEEEQSIFQTEQEDQQYYISGDSAQSSETLQKDESNVEASLAVFQSEKDPYVYIEQDPQGIHKSNQQEPQESIQEAQPATQIANSEDIQQNEDDGFGGILAVDETSNQQIAEAAAATEQPQQQTTVAPQVVSEAIDFSTDPEQEIYTQDTQSEQPEWKSQIEPQWENVAQNTNNDNNNVVTQQSDKSIANEHFSNPIPAQETEVDEPKQTVNQQYLDHDDEVKKEVNQKTDVVLKVEPAKAKPLEQSQPQKHIYIYNPLAKKPFMGIKYPPMPITKDQNYVGNLDTIQIQLPAWSEESNHISDDDLDFFQFIRPSDSSSNEY